MPASKPTTPPRTRVTVAMLQEVEARADAYAARAQQHEQERIKAQAEVASLEGELAKLRAAAEPEAQALAGCVHAIEAMHAAERASRSYSGGIAYTATAGAYDAASSPVGRILLHLAARYGVPLVPPPPDPTPETVLVQAPGHLAQPLRELLGREL